MGLKILEPSTNRQPPTGKNTPRSQRCVRRGGAWVFGAGAGDGDDEGNDGDEGDGRDGDEGRVGSDRSHDEGGGGGEEEDVGCRGEFRGQRGR